MIYHDQLMALEKKISDSYLEIPFKWKDAFHNGLFSKKFSSTIPKLQYEKVILLLFIYL